MLSYGKKVVGLTFATAMASLLPVTAFADWAGPYAGVSLSYGNGNSEDLSLGVAPFDLEGAQIEGFVGYNWQSGSYVYGGELSYAVGDIKGTDDSFMRPLTINDTAMLKARVGYDAGALLPYGFIGAVWGVFEGDHQGNGEVMADNRFSGVAYGLGVDYALNDTTFVRAELSRREYRANHLLFDTNPFPNDQHDIAASNVTSLSIGIGMRF